MLPPRRNEEEAAEAAEVAVEAMLPFGVSQNSVISNAFPSFFSRFPFCFDVIGTLGLFRRWEIQKVFPKVDTSVSRSVGQAIIFHPRFFFLWDFAVRIFFLFFLVDLFSPGRKKSGKWKVFYEDVEERDGMNEEMKGGREGKEWKMLFLWDTDRCVTFSKRPDLPQEGKNRNEFPHLEVHKNCFPKQCSP